MDLGAGIDTSEWEGAGMKASDTLKTKDGETWAESSGAKAQFVEVCYVGAKAPTP